MSKEEKRYLEFGRTNKGCASLQMIKKLVDAGDTIRDDEFYCDTGDEVHNDAGE